MRLFFLILAYVAVIVVANIATASTAPAAIGPFLVTWGTWFIGGTFILRDFIQVRAGKAVAYSAIFSALIASALASVALGDLLAITVASAVAFGISEAADTEVFSKLRARFSTRVAVSGLIGGTLDSVAFAVIGLSPLWTGFVPWEALPNVILGQVIVKGALQGFAAGGLRLMEPRPA